MGESQLPGPVCNQLKEWGWLDDGTTCQKPSTAPGPIDWKKEARKNAARIAKENYLNHAREVSYMMTAQSHTIGGHPTACGIAVLGRD